MNSTGCNPWTSILNEALGELPSPAAASSRIDPGVRTPLRAYADSSFLVKLLARESGSERAVAEYRRLRLPRLFYLPLHSLEA